MKSGEHLVVVAVAVALLGITACGASRFSFCRPIDTPEDCVHGYALDFCGRTVCAKGPGKACGGPRNFLGVCGEGMHCKCEKCIGCSLETFTCYNSSAVCF